MFNSIKIPGAFFVAAMCWVIFGNSVIAVLTPHATVLQEDQYRQINNFIFVVITTFVLYILIKAQQRALRKSEEEYRQLFESNPNPMWICDAESFRFVKANSVAVHKYQISHRRFLRMTLFDIHLKEEVEALRERLQQHRGDPVNHPWTHVIPSGERFAVSITARPVILNHRTYVLVMATDISEIIERKSKLKGAYEKIKEFSETLMQITWTHSHKVRKPLCSIIALLDLLKQSDHEEERAELVLKLEVSALELDDVLRSNAEKVNKLETFHINEAV